MTAVGEAPAFVPMRIRTCSRCGFSFPAVPKIGRPPSLCPDCRGAPRPTAPPRGGTGGFDPDAPGYRLALLVTDYRLAIETATSALRLGQITVALAVLDDVAAPTRQHSSQRNHRR